MAEYQGKIQNSDSTKDNEKNEVMGTIIEEDDEENIDLENNGKKILTEENDFEENKVDNNFGYNLESQPGLISSRKASIVARGSYTLDRNTYYNNFKMPPTIKKDTKFKPDLAMLVGKRREKEFKHLKNLMKFKEVNEIFPESRFVYNHNTSQNFIIFPGYYNPPALVIVMYLLNQNRKLLKRIFLKDAIDEDNNFFSVNLFLENKWESVQIDHFLPLVENKMAFMISNKKEAWPCLLEKAIAKKMGSYYDTSNLLNLENLIRICTGCFTKKYFFMKNLKDKSLFDYLLFWKEIANEGHLICIKTKSRDTIQKPPLKQIQANS